MAAIARNADEGDRILREANEWERDALMRGASRQAFMRDKRGERANESLDKIDAKAAANLGLKRITLKEKEFFKSEIFHRRRSSIKK